MAAGHVNRAELSSHYQNPGDVYEDTKTEGAYEVLAKQTDENWDDYALHKNKAEIDHPDGSITNRKIAPGTLTADKFVSGSLNNDTQNGLLITTHINEKASDTVRPHGMGRAAAQDYEEGTWTPAFVGTSVAGNHTYAKRIGVYKKIGKLVVAQFRLTLSSKDVGITGNLRISGLPFAASTGTDFQNVGSIGFVGGISSSSLDSDLLQLSITALGSQLDFSQIRKSANGIGVPVAYLTNTTDIIGSIAYQIP